MLVGIHRLTIDESNSKIIWKVCFCARGNESILIPAAETVISTCKIELKLLIQKCSLLCSIAPIIVYLYQLHQPKNRYWLSAIIENVYQNLMIMVRKLAVKL